MPIVIEQQLQAMWHAAADVRDMIEVCGLPLHPDPMLQFFHRSRVMRVHAALEVAP